jgi:6-pyruvoyltetrahydropterin/6-carboxytetrahydropterin synthase
VFEIGVQDEFEAAHVLRGDFGDATRLHGHTYRVEVVVEGSSIGQSGVFYDLGRLRSDLRLIMSDLHYRDLNDVAGLNDVNTTAEVVARYIFGRMEPSLREAGVASLKVKVWESPSVFASYRESFN